MIQAHEDQPNPAELRAHLEQDVLHLPDAVITMDIQSYFNDALKTQAILLVDLLVRLQENQINRSNPVLADFKSDRRGNEYRLYTERWTQMLKRAIYALAKTAGITVFIDDNFDISSGDIPRIIEQLEYLTLPSSLQQRIEKTRQLQPLTPRESVPQPLSIEPQKSKIRTLLARIGISTNEEAVVEPTQAVPAALPVDFYLETHTVPIDKETEVRPNVWEYTAQITSISLASNPTGQNLKT